MFRKLRYKLLCAAVFIFMLTTQSVVGQAAGLQDNYSKKIAIGLTSLNDSTSLDFTITDNYFIQENNQVLVKGPSYKVTLVNSVFILSQDGKQIASLDNITITPNSGTSYISFVKNTYSRLFSGSLTFIKLTPSTFVPVNKLNMEDYIKGVVPYESSESYPIEALKAQAVAARTYALANLGKFSSYGYDLTDDVRCQVYRGYSNICPKSNQAVEATRGQVLTYNGDLISTLYSASNGGYTESSGNVWTTPLPYFVSKVDTFDTDTTYNWVKTFTAAELEGILKTNSKLSAEDKFTGININTIRYYPSGRVSNIEVNYTDSTGASQTKAFSKEGARTFLSLRSAMYTVSLDAVKNIYTFTGKGYGHGIGLSQSAANNRAKSGQTYQQILSFYYDNTSIKSLIQTGLVNMDGKTYYMDSKGVPVTKAWILNSVGKWNYFDLDGAMVKGGWYKDYLGRWYYFEADGSMASNKLQQDGSGKWFYLGNDGIMVKSKWAYISNNWYYFDLDGARAEGKWQQDSSKKWFYLGTDGIMLTSKMQQDRSTRWFYLASDGAMVVNKWVQDSSKWYYFGSDGARLESKWQQDNSKRWFYLGANGEMAASQWVLYKGSYYYLNADGAMAVNTTIEGYKINNWGVSNKPVQ